MADIDETRVESFAAEVANTFYDIAYRAVRVGWNAGYDRVHQDCMEKECAGSKKQPKTPAGEYRYDGKNGWVKKPAEDQICESGWKDEKPLGKGLDEW